MRGEYQHNIDAKGRMIFPVRLREELGEHAVIFRGLDHCLTVFPAEKWAKLQEKLDALPSRPPISTVSPTSAPSTGTLFRRWQTRRSLF